ncbi:MAG: ABC transporter substrate-binding protein [Oscillospiraceae bacterium]|nr:ABC transporter substrate-binding protein [Oscillospiraceae bacterium]
MYESLFEVNADFSYVKALCDTFSTEDGKVYRFYVKKGVKFHDGSELTAADVAYSLELARVSDNYASRLSIITAAYVLEDIVFVELNRVNFNLPLLLDVPIVKNNSGKESVPVGTGPYVFNDAGEYIYLKAFSEHRDFQKLPAERIYLKEYEGGSLLTAFDSGLIDLVTTSKADINYLEYSGNTELRHKDTTVLYFLGINRRNAFLGDKNRRQLFSSFIDREMLAEDIITAVQTTIPLHPSAYFNSDEYDTFTISEQDIEDAKIQYLVEDYDRDGMLEYLDLEENSVEEITLRLLVNKENPAKVQMARALRSSLAEVGIAVELSELNWDGYLRALKNAEYDIFLGEVMLTADFDLTQLLSYGGSANYGVYDAQLQTLIYDFNASAEDGKQEEAAQLYSYIAEHLPIISLMFEIETIYTHREAVSGISPTVHNLFCNITDWSIAAGRK